MKQLKRFFLWLFPDTGEAEANFDEVDGVKSKSAKAKLTWKW
jgi:hypothetical protein